MTNEKKNLAKRRAVLCIERGGNFSDCASHAGIDRATLYRWRKQDATFATRLSQARIEYKLSLITSVRERKPEFLLERQFREEFGKEVSLKAQIHTNPYSFGDANPELVKKFNQFLKEDMEKKQLTQK